VGTPDAQHRNSLVLTENNKSNKQERTLDQQDAGPGLRETLLSPIGHTLQRRARGELGGGGGRELWGEEMDMGTTRVILMALWPIGMKAND
jgi:hypothetical protein